MFQLNKREQLLLKILIGLIIVLGVYFIIISPLISLQSNINTKFEDNTEKIERLRKLYDDYQEIKRKRIQYESKINSSERIITIIEENAKNLNISSNKSYINEIPGNTKDNYKKISAEAKFVSVDITTILKFIYNIENSSSMTKINFIKITEALKGREIYDFEIKIDSVTSQ